MTLEEQHAARLRQIVEQELRQREHQQAPAHVIHRRIGNDHVLNRRLATRRDHG